LLEKSMVSLPNACNACGKISEKTMIFY